MPAPDTLTLHRFTCTNTGYVEDLGNGVELTMMQIPAGKFLMGSSTDEFNSPADDERPQHLVTVPHFFIASTPITQGQWRIVAGYEPIEVDLTPDPSHFKRDNLPVEQVSWYEAKEFCHRLSAKTKLNYRFPSEAEWEYACRAETNTAYHSGPRITKELANYDGQGTTTVQTYQPNRWGLYDMHGNVYEWCEDNYHDTYKNAPNDGSAWIEAETSNQSRILRGGSWIYNPWDCRSACRNGDTPDHRYSNIGFRVCYSAPRTL